MRWWDSYGIQRTRLNTRGADRLSVPRLKHQKQMSYNVSQKPKARSGSQSMHERIWRGQSLSVVLRTCLPCKTLQLSVT